jgi:nucleoid-associated protein YgaU
MFRVLFLVCLVSLLASCNESDFHSRLALELAKADTRMDMLHSSEATVYAPKLYAKAKSNYAEVIKYQQSENYRLAHTRLPAFYNTANKAIYQSLDVQRKALEAKEKEGGSSSKVVDVLSEPNGNSDVNFDTNPVVIETIVVPKESSTLQKQNQIVSEATIDSITTDNSQNAPSSNTTFYIIQKGDWLYKIAREKYGRTLDWRRIYVENKTRIKNPKLIYPDQIIILPQ